MIPAAVVFAYLAIVLYIGIFARGSSARQPDAEDYFLAGRSLGPAVFLLSLFGTNMTAFSILGASGHAFANGIVTYGLMASSSALIIPVSIFVIGTRLWALGKRYGFMTPVQMFRDRWECGHIGTVIFAVQAVTALEAAYGGSRERPVHAVDRAPVVVQRAEGHLKRGDVSGSGPGGVGHRAHERVGEARPSVRAHDDQVRFCALRLDEDLLVHHTHP